MPHQLVASLVLATSLSAPAPGASPLWAGTATPHGGVGVSMLEAAVVWYPAALGSGTRLRVRDLLGDDAAPFAAFLARQDVPPSAIDRVLDAEMLARRDAAPLPGRFPLVLLAVGNRDAPADAAVLAEILASHGFLVAATPSPTRATPMQSEDEVGRFAERQADDLAAVVDVLADWPNVDATRIAAVGQSFGARSALLLAMRDARVRALLSLDGGIGTATAAASLRAAPSFDAARATLPILHLYQDLDAFMTPDFTLLRSLATRDLKLERMTGLHHIHFTTTGFFAAFEPALARATGAEPGLPQGLAAVVRRTLDFLATHIKNEPGRTTQAR